MKRILTVAFLVAASANASTNNSTITTKVGYIDTAKAAVTKAIIKTKAAAIVVANAAKTAAVNANDSLKVVETKDNVTTVRYSKKRVALAVLAAAAVAEIAYETYQWATKDSNEDEEELV